MWGVLQWLEFSKLNGIYVKGKGIIDGQGSVWWKNTPLLIEEYEGDYYSEEQDDYAPKIALVIITYSSIYLSYFAYPFPFFLGV